MKCRDACVGGIALVVVLLLLVFAHGRPVKGRLFKELEEKADLIVIGTVESSDDAKNWVYENPDNTTWVAVDSVGGIGHAQSMVLCSPNLNGR